MGLEGIRLNLSSFKIRRENKFAFHKFNDLIKILLKAVQIVIGVVNPLLYPPSFTIHQANIFQYQNIEIKIHILRGDNTHMHTSARAMHTHTQNRLKCCTVGIVIIMALKETPN